MINPFARFNGIPWINFITTPGSHVINYFPKDLGSLPSMCNNLFVSEFLNTKFDLKFGSSGFAWTSFFAEFNLLFSFLHSSLNHFFLFCDSMYYSMSIMRHSKIKYQTHLMAFKKTFANYQLAPIYNFAKFF